MDRDTLDALKTALEVTPENRPLRLAVVRAAAELGESQLALDSLAPLAPEQVEKEEDRIMAARLVAAANRAGEALDWIEDLSGPEVDLLRAGLLLDLGQEAEAAAAYRRAIAANPTLQDRSLEEGL